jgi:hypothetical protein
MKIIVTHTSPDLDAITSVWLIKTFLPNWQDAKVEFVQAGDRIHDRSKTIDVIENIDGNEMIHVDTGLGPLDHHQLPTEKECASTLTWKYVKKFLKGKDEKWDFKEIAIERIVKIVLEVDHFKEVFWRDPTSDYYDFSFIGIIDGLKIEKPDDDPFYIEFGMVCLDAILREFENKVWAEQEIKEKGIIFETRFGKAIAIESLNDTVIKLSQKMGYELAVRKDPRKGYVRIKAKPSDEGRDIDLTLAYEKFKKIDPQATWFLHVNKKMLLNGTPKNKKMRASSLSINQIMEVLKSI